MSKLSLSKLSQRDPYLDHGLRGWLYNAARKNVHRIAGFDVDDLHQEGLVCYYKCKERYIGKRGRWRYLPPDNPDRESVRHFMALVKRTFTNRIHDLAMHQPAWQEQPILQHEDDNETQRLEQLLPSHAGEGEMTMAAMVRNAPKEMQQLFDLLLGDVVQGYRRFGWNGAATRALFPGLTPCKQYRRARRETTNEYFCRLLGKPSTEDVAGRVRRYFLRGEC